MKTTLAITMVALLIGCQKQTAKQTAPNQPEIDLATPAGWTLMTNRGGEWSIGKSPGIVFFGTNRNDAIAKAKLFEEHVKANEWHVIKDEPVP